MKAIITIYTILIFVIVNAQTINTNQILHPEEKKLRGIIENDSLLLSIYEKGYTFAKEIVDQKITEGLLRHSLVSDLNFPELYDDAVEISNKLGISAPEHIFIKQENEIGASTIVADSGKYVMFIHSAVFDVMTRKERKILLAHELTHAKLQHSRYAILIKLLQKTDKEKLAELLEITGFGIIQLFRYYEYSADRGAYLSAGANKQDFLSTIMRFASGVSLSKAKQTVKGFEKQIDEFIELGLSTSDIEKYYAEMPERKQDNPFPILKAIEIKKFMAELQE